MKDEQKIIPRRVAVLLVLRPDGGLLFVKYFAEIILGTKRVSLDASRRKIEKPTTGVYLTYMTEWVFVF